MNTATRQHRNPYVHRSCIASVCAACDGTGRTIVTRGTWTGDIRCEACDGYGETYRSEFSEPETDPEPTPPAGAALIVTDSFEIAGHRVTAPGFSPESFDRAIKRAHDDGLTLEATDRGDCVLVSNPVNGRTYTTSRRSCSCRAGQAGTPCKHIAYAVFMADIVGALPTPAGHAA